ncbi:ATP-binding cassette subfamily B protein [Thermosporothrix hazakensis]|uniref:ATP-binding cassette subfamily B protein n=2 Tax=Thermosporothrix TaxID=768650 RepID=A0A326U3E1_THEHA|nr:ABC transporter ATP-binding protein [Thermosporothrix hazakensis]PZW26580.1 ATP-binding cassette subfamily B protein [Thermosporothrix hazakensis]BBH89535.1 ABC transporter [Thermosporothrix sp. COM3]GCE47718.1 ABC transporter [Thermosporothrix hazakensis]
MAKREFTVTNEYHYNTSSPTRWIISHLFRYKFLIITFIVLALATNTLYSQLRVFTGSAFDAVLQHNEGQLVFIAVAMLASILLCACVDLGARSVVQLLGSRFARDAREELYISLLGKSQTFHNRQRVGDIMARAANDMNQLQDMVVPGFDVIFDSFSSMAVVIIYIGLLNPQLLLVPVLYVIGFLIALYFYSRTLNPVSRKLREQFGVTNAVLNEAISGIEVVKSTSQEEQEKQKFAENATKYRDYFVRSGQIQGRYLPTLLFGIALALCFLHGLFLLLNHQITLGTLVSFMALAGNLRFVTDMSTWSFNLVQLGVAGSKRIIDLMKEETELDENDGGYQGEMQGDIVFENVSFGYGTTPILKNVSFHAKPGQTIAIVGQTGSGKSTLTKLVNRIYDAQQGRVLIDGKDVRQWNLDSLRSQISTIEQDIFLFSRSIAENIAYGFGSKADQAAIENAAKDAQAHEFIMSFKEGYNTVVGERGVMLSGGQRQRIAIARALLTDPRILILDDSTSAIDSATEDQIQKAIKRVLQGRTTLLITHRLSQIRWADKVLVMRNGALIDQGTHDELMERCDTYRRIFSHYDSAPATEQVEKATAVGGE